MKIKNKKAVVLIFILIPLITGLGKALFLATLEAAQIHTFPEVLSPFSFDNLWGWFGSGVVFGIAIGICSIFSLVLWFLLVEYIKNKS